MMNSPFSFNFQQPQQQSNNSSSLQQILSMRKQQGAQPVQAAQGQDMSQPQFAAPQGSRAPIDIMSLLSSVAPLQDTAHPQGSSGQGAPIDFMQLAGAMGYKPDANASQADQQSGAMNHIMTTFGSYF